MMSTRSQRDFYRYVPLRFHLLRRRENFSPVPSYLPRWLGFVLDFPRTLFNRESFDRTRRYASRELSVIRNFAGKQIAPTRRFLWQERTRGIIDRSNDGNARTLRIVSYVVVVSYDSKSSSSEQRVRLFLHVFSSQYHRAQSTQSSCATYRSLSWLTIIKLESIIIWRLIHFVVSIRILIYNGRQRSYPNY